MTKSGPTSRSTTAAPSSASIALTFPQGDPRKLRASPSPLSNDSKRYARAERCKSKGLESRWSKAPVALWGQVGHPDPNVKELAWREERV